MSALVEKLTGKSEYETRTYEIEARPDHLDQLEELFAWMNMTSGGHSGSALLYVDGDGAARLTVTRQDGDLKVFDADAHPSQSGGKPELEIGLD